MEPQILVCEHNYTKSTRKILIYIYIYIYKRERERERERDDMSTTFLQQILSGMLLLVVIAGLKK